MKDHALIKAYRTAWRWPEVYSEDKWVIWVSRIIAIVIPAALVALTFLTGVPLFGWIASLGISGLFALIIAITTIKLFYTEYPTVQHFEEREAHIKEFFHGYPAYTDIPIIELDPGVWVAYGHVSEAEFLQALRTIVRNVTEDEEIVSRYSDLEKSVGHLYATFRNPEEGHWDEGLDLCKHTTEHCFPITRVEV